ncbi:MAG: NADH:flavin oxidoreductase/NADH oxidase family protein [Acinetobacter populi]|jgi:2,4-dienoyl-CoA reductase-like NADH-dependent reductase (Old Yellow Enzyme family)|uniref:NADH:flavin oxidoreductase/NADH oxidase family protein n=1 Tax=Acinetobacter populi TaxID=1582270 RepID=UPI002356CE12|nr:NADH:flavin oxidoreductase/NADH oxidase family protein [Acinetobacter populi]MCH4247024.1 NADH:flavin oxidoreductase/NADH oxidase family protein [Acinetobacter populi]
MRNVQLNTSLLNQPIMLPNGSVIPNRLAKAATSETLATYSNNPTEKHVRLYQRWASSGIGLIITGNIMIDRRALGEPGNVVVEDERDFAILQKWAKTVTEQGSQLWAQLNHPGKQSPKGLNIRNISASAVPFEAEMQSLFATPYEATHDEIIEIIQRFGRSALICKKAGFSGVEIHAAHGYLINQFLSPLHNLRKDEWGGTPEKRRKFLLEVYKEIRKQVGADFPVAIKLNSADFQKGGFTEEDSFEVIKALSIAGIDLIEISGGTYESGVAKAPQKSSTIAREAFFIDFAQKVRAHVKTPLMVTGGFRSVEGMNQALESNAFDVVGIARLMAIDPDAPRFLLSGLNGRQTVKPIKTGIKKIDALGIMEVLWYTQQLKRISRGNEPKPNESGLWAFIKSVLRSGWGTYATQRTRSK